ncbi:ribulose-phosphate 3-epimerase [Myxococcota bacterium]|nr:ribulose-phosphate 3-epimerase [Myxococcota bacterium]MBU1536668.1 ribulose-phosphate 3-epimerase [Myxococcota bacterium]
MPVTIAPSVLSADFLRLEQEVNEVRGVEYLHVDVMDGHYVPNITFGPKIVKHLASLGIPLDVHLMIEKPERYLEDFIAAGAHFLTVHPEASVHLHRTIHAIRELGARPGVALNPSTPPEAIEFVLADVDLVLVMTVNPGFGGQKFIHGQLAKIARLRAMIDALPGRKPILEVDGGIDPETAPLAVRAGAEMLVAGSAVFSRPDRQAAIRAIRAAAAV